MLRGLTTVRFHATDLAAAKRWYIELLGVEPYFERPGYAEFRFGDHQHELGLLDSAYAGQLGGTEDREATGPTGAVVYWHVDDVPATLARLGSMGAKEHEAPRDFGGGFVGASVLDPFGNVLGVMYNPHYLAMLATS
ncbi:glyoxalase [Streptomyces spiroverticillatus]|uniref:Glyoxalase n=1 Tax=Streptomyces finlayi TaxID=67296 RepID=A0A918WS08_9ACTN|nr:VOC family protein [Streptomyces finlayi]GGZ84893.1 glyoxalase [Streptomyces spiroverticillatus]GHC76629.1 glyoxalase [Streptomyces finlayi]